MVGAKKKLRASSLRSYRVIQRRWKGISMVRQFSLLVCSLLVLAAQGSHYHPAARSSNANPPGSSTSPGPTTSNGRVDANALLDYAREKYFGAIIAYISKYRNVFSDKPHLLNIQDEDGNTVLHLAVKGKYFKCYTFLVEQGADYTIKNEAGETVRNLVTGDQEFEEVLQKQEDKISKKTHAKRRHNPKA